MIKDEDTIRFEELLGKTILSITGAEDGSAKIQLETLDGKKYVMTHYGDGCDTVTLEDTCGDIADIIGSPILLAEKVVSTEDNPLQLHYTWSFYKLSTIKGSVTLRWCGFSEGYYSEDVGFYEVD